MADSAAEIPRRSFLRLAAAGAAGAAGVAGGLTAACSSDTVPGDAPNVVTQPNVQWRLASSYPRSLDALYGGAELLAEKLSAITEGRFQIRPYPAGELVPALQVLDATQSGSVQVGQTPAYYYTGKNPALAFETAVPFGLTARQQAAWMLRGGGQELMREIYSDFGIINFLGGDTGAQMGGWFRREVNGVSDLKGLKMRIPGLGGDVMNRLGVTVQVLGAAEIYPALERGAIDATEWVGPYDDEKLGFHRVARFYYYPGWWEPGGSATFMVNRAAWDQLPKSYQEAFEVAVRTAAQHSMMVYDVKNPEALQRLLSGGTQLRKFSEDIMVASAAASRDLLESNASADAGGYGKIYTAWKKFRDDSARWFGTAEQEYARYAFKG
jgi:TRAP-type mannitol/chloroaromatic compound transport system substrate-binding protein